MQLLILHPKAETGQPLIARRKTALLQTVKL